MKTKNVRKSVSAPVAVKMQDGSTALVTKLLTLPVKRKLGRVNQKLSKTNERQDKFFVVGLSLAPANSSGYEVCASRSPGCTKACLASSGFGGIFPNISRARVAKTRLLYQDRALFMAKLYREIERAQAKATAYGRRLAVRLNVFSDLLWEKIEPELFTTFPDVVFYDYTKHFSRMKRFCKGELPHNYHLTFSRSETNDKQAMEVLKLGGNVTVVFSGEMPTEWRGYKVVNGDETDLRFEDGHNVVVGLKVKGHLGLKDKSGFVVRIPTSEEVLEEIREQAAKANAKRVPLRLCA